MNNTQSNTFDFDAWRALAESDPAAFEARREAEIQKLLDAASPDRQQRLRGLQWRIDMERGRCRTPMDATVRVFNMMWDSVYGRRGLLAAVQGLEEGPTDLVTKSPPASATLLRFKGLAREAQETA